MMYRGSRNEGAAPLFPGALVFLAAREEFAQTYARDDGTVHRVHVRCEHPFDAARGEGRTLWRAFEQDTKTESWALAGTDRGALPFWTMEPRIRAWLDSKQVKYDGIWFAENDRSASLAVVSLDQIRILDPRVSRAASARTWLESRGEKASPHA